MQQIQQHEWMVYGNPQENMSLCPHCKTIMQYRAFMNPLYFDCQGYGQVLTEEPDCISRPINAPLRNAEK